MLKKSFSFIIQYYLFINTPSPSGASLNHSPFHIPFFHHLSSSTFEHNVYSIFKKYICIVIDKNLL